VALLTSSRKGSDVSSGTDLTQSEQEGLTHLHAQRAARCGWCEPAFYRTEQALEQGPSAVEPLREGPPHLGTHPAHSPRFLPALRGNHTLRPELLPDICYISLAVKFGVGQHQTDARQR